MKIFPYEEYIIKSNLTLNEIIIKLQENVEPKKYFRLNWFNTKPFQGIFSDNKFEITRIISYRNSFIPIIKGEINYDGIQSTINIKMQLHIFVKVFMIIWISFPLLFLLFSLEDFIGFIKGTQKFDSAILTPLTMILFGVGICIIPFWFESIKAKKILNEMFTKE